MCKKGGTCYGIRDERVCTVGSAVRSERKGVSVWEESVIELRDLFKHAIISNADVNYVKDSLLSMTAHY